MLCTLHLLIVPDRISECETETAVYVKDLGAVEGDGGIAVDSDRDAILAGEFNAFDYALVAEKLETVAVLGILHALMEIGDRKDQSFALEGERSAHARVADAHLDRDGTADKVAISEMGYI